jgi:hypothetical protein
MKSKILLDSERPPYSIDAMANFHLYNKGEWIAVIAMTSCDTMEKALDRVSDAVEDYPEATHCFIEFPDEPQKGSKTITL